jgi:hypothetical protein
MPSIDQMGASFSAIEVHQWWPLDYCTDIDAGRLPSF